MKVKDWYTRLADHPKAFFWMLMGILLPVLIYFSLNFPVNIDEPLHYAHAQKNLNWFLSGGEDLSCFDTGKTNLEHYAQSPDNLSALINHVLNVQDDFRSRHILGALFAWLLLLFVGLSVFEITSNYRAAQIAVLLVLITPSFMGQYCNNLKDIPFAMGYAFCTWTGLRFLKNLPHPSWKDTLLLGVAIAVLNSVRMGGIVFIPYMGFFILLWLVLNYFKEKSFPGNKSIGFLTLKLAVVILIAYFGSMVFWPYALTDPIRHPVESFRMMSNYIVSIRQNFEGELIWSTNLPDYYLPKWLLISIPEVIWIALLTGIFLLVFVFRRTINSNWQYILNGFVLFSLLFPIFHVIRINSNMYCGWRQFYFLLVPISILSAGSLIRFYQLLKHKGIKALFIAAFTLSLVLSVRHYARGIDHSYIYFNSFSGGNTKAWGNYEYDYYFHTAKESSEWFFSNIPLSDSTIVASDFDIRLYNKDSLSFQYIYSKYDSRSYADWEYGLFSINYLHPYRLAHNTWQSPDIIKTFYHTGKPVAFVIKRSSLKDRTGLQLVKEKEYLKAIPYLTSALGDNQNNIILYGALGHAWLQTGEITKSGETIAKGLKVNPYYEYLLLLDAKISFEKRNYSESLTKCKNIVEINPKYYDVCVLMARCYDQLGQADKAEQIRNYYKSIMSYLN